MSNVGENVEQLLYSAGRNVNWYNHFRKFWHFLKNLNIPLPYHPSIPFLGIYPKEMEAMSMQRLVHKLMPALFVVVPNWNNPNIHQTVYG